MKWWSTSLHSSLLLGWSSPACECMLQDPMQASSETFCQQLCRFSYVMIFSQISYMLSIWLKKKMLPWITSSWLLSPFFWIAGFLRPVTFHTLFFIYLQCTVHILVTEHSFSVLSPWRLRPDNLFCGELSEHCVQQHPWPLPTTCQQHPYPSVWQPKMSRNIAEGQQYPILRTTDIEQTE